MRLQVLHGRGAGLCHCHALWSPRLHHCCSGASCVPLPDLSLPTAIPAHPPRHTKQVQRRIKILEDRLQQVSLSR